MGAVKLLSDKKLSRWPYRHLPDPDDTKAEAKAKRRWVIDRVTKHTKRLGIAGYIPFGGRWLKIKTQGEYYEAKYGIKFSKPEFERLYNMTRAQRRAHCLGRMKRETGRTFPY